MKKSLLKKQEILNLPILTFFVTHLKGSLETKIEKTLYSLMEKSLLVTFGHAWLGEKVEILLLSEPAKLKTECVLEGVSYGPKSHDLIREFFLLNGFSDAKKYPLLKELQTDSELEHISTSLRSRCYDHLEIDLQLKHPYRTI